MHAELDAILKGLKDDDTVRDFLGLVAVATGDPALAKLPPVVRFVDAAATAGGLERYFEKHPLPDALLDAVRRLAQKSDTAPDDRAADRLLGVARTAPVSSSPPAPGSVRGGVFARVAATKKR